MRPATQSEATNQSLDTNDLVSQIPSSSPVGETSKAIKTLRKLKPYWYTYTTRAKGRWFDREILELVSTEFRDRSIEYYRYALESGVTTINGKIAQPNTIVRNGDLLENMVHRHEPPITSKPIGILLHDREREILVIDKPGSIPVHACGRYYRHSLVELLKSDFGFDQVKTVNRLDRLTSGLMILALSTQRARALTDEFTAGQVRKEYIARVKGEFPAEEVRCEEPLLTIDRQMGLNIVHPEGKPAQTIFKRLHYDAGTNSSVVHCRPLTGRSHQLRVHLQYLGHPIANDPVYSDENIWGKKVGTGGLDLVPSDERSPPEPPPEHQDSPAEGRDRLIRDLRASVKHQKSLSNPAWRTKAESRVIADELKASNTDEDGQAIPKLLPRETGHDIGMGSPVPLSKEAVNVIKNLRDQKDRDEDWSRWRDVIFRAKEALNPRDAKAQSAQQNAAEGSETDLNSTVSKETAQGPAVAAAEDGTLYCPECYIPLHPDPKPEALYIFLHALRYTTSLGSFETDMPEWSARNWEWETGKTQS